MKAFFYLIFFFLPSLGFVVERQPWFGNTYEFNLLSKYAYSHFSSVDSAVVPLVHSSDDHLLYFDLEFPFSPNVSFDVDLEAIDTPRESFGFRSFALQGRYLVYDDIIGDPLSLVIGGNIRGVSNKALRDISNPYHGNVNFEATLAIGKEFAQFDFWIFRLWGLFGIGQANKGSPWVITKGSLEGCNHEANKWAFILEGAHGYGKKTKVNIDHFKGYGTVRAKNLDIGFRFGHKFNQWGSLSLEYKRRILAKSCPKNVNTFEISYLLPFSF